MKNNNNLIHKNRQLEGVFIALFAAIICVGGFIAIPTAGGIPIVLQNMLPVLTGILLGGIEGILPTILFLTAGALGLPVFSGGSGGFAVFMGPTGGFLIGYAIAALVSSLIVGKPDPERKKLSCIIRLTVAAVAGLTVMYVPGVIHFMLLTKKDFATTMAACVIPFIPGYFVKIVLTVILAYPLRKTVYRYLYSEYQGD